MTSQYITTTDGTRIAIDLYLPTDSTCASPRACILTQTRYFRSISLRWPWRLLANQGRPFSFLHTRYYEGMLGAGYAVVAMDIRGTGASFGTVLHPWLVNQMTHVLERQDSVDVIDWITRQPWSNGRVGLWGMSYEATAAYLTVSTHHPAIKACVPMYMFYDMYNDIASPGMMILLQTVVVIGPWNHSGVQFYNPVTQIHQRSACDHVNRVVSFFRHHLNDDVTACSAATFTGAIEYFTLGDNTWRVATSWPPPHTTRRDFFLSMNDRALVTDVRAIQPGSCTWNVECQRDLGGVSRWQATIDVYEPMQYHGWHAANHVVFTSLPFDHSVTVQYYLCLQGQCRAAHAPQDGAGGSMSRQSSPTYLDLVPHNPDPDVPRHSFYERDRRPIPACTKVTFGLLPIAFQAPRKARLQVRICGHDAKHFTQVDPTRTMELTADATACVSSLSLPILEAPPL
ncbi:hypothetical protein DYB35_006516 [Aphanomyces astaci]|uniref:Xaa-Pro dipeptidyl-peptidase-like domain-containing protein n=1 Tax=Aphanomyces astaci TaxID=112090 RepID=A0A418CX43_APHAT|nr:hypothetical protein DYB35_006516 [Aphanomyces astaci]